MATPDWTSLEFDAIAVPTREWITAGFGPLDYPSTLRWVIPGVTFTAFGIQCLLSSFFVSILQTRRR